MRTVLATLAFSAVLFGQAAPSYKALKYPPLKQVQIPEPITFTLPNGMRIYLLENHELPIVSGFALVRAGNLFDPPDKRGLAEITGTVIRSGGTKARTGDQLDEELENVAAGVESQIAESSATVSFSALKENLSKVLPVFRDVLTAPEFRQEKIDLALSQARSAIARRNDDPSGIVSREFPAILYGRNTPYGWQIEYEHLDNIKREDLIGFYRRYYFPANVMLAVYGDFDAAALRKQLEDLFAGWTVQQPPVPAFPAVTAKAAPGIYLAEKEDVTQTFFEIGHLGGTLKEKDYPALQVAADILGSGFTSRLLRKVRTELGWAYSVNASWNAQFDHPGTFSIGGSTKSATTAETLQVIREELEKMRTAEVSDQELQIAKDTVLNGFVFNFDRPSKTLNRLIRYDYFGYPKDFIFQYQKAVAAVTKADVLRVARQYWKMTDLTIVAVGNPKEFGKPLSSLGMNVQKIDLTIPPPPKKRAAPKDDAASVAKAKALLAKAQAALGGAAKFAAVKDFVQTVEVTIQMPQGGPGMKATQRNYALLPDHFRQDQEFPFGKVVIYSDGKSGWMSTPQGLQPMPPPVIDQVRTEMFREFIKLILSDRDPARKLAFVEEDNTVVISGDGGRQIEIQIDPGTGLPQKETYTTNGRTLEETWSEWKDVDGIKLPGAFSVIQAGKKFADSVVKEYKLNTGVTVEEISKKP